MRAENMDENTKISRTQIDNPYRRNTAPTSYKNRKFDGYRIATDEYTGKKVFYSSKGVGGGGNDRHFTTKTTANIDHVTPIDVLRERYGGQISSSALKEIANSDYNLALTNEMLNKQKNKLTNSQYLYKQFVEGHPEDPITTIKMLKAQGISEVHMAADVTKAKIDIAIERSRAAQPVRSVASVANVAISDAAHSGIDAAVVTLTVSGLNNLIAVASGKKDVPTAVKDTVTDIGSSAVSAAGIQLTEKVIAVIADQTGSKVLSGIAANGIPVAEIALACMVANSMDRYLKGEISGEDCALEILINGAGTFAFQMGMALGGPAAAVITSMVVSVIANEIVAYRQEQKVRKARDAEIDYVLSRAMTEILRQRKLLKDDCDQKLKYWDDCTEAGFELIVTSALEDNSAGITQGISIILSLFNANVIYPSLEDFDKDFFNPNAPAIILK